MERTKEIEKKINDYYSFSYANDVELSESENREIDLLVNEGVKLGSAYAIKIKGMQLYDSWKVSGYIGPCPENCKEYIEESARYGFGECMWKIAEDPMLGFTLVERYAYRKASKYLLEDLPYFELNESDLVNAENLADSIEKDIIKFYETPEHELLMCADLEIDKENDNDEIKSTLLMERVHKNDEESVKLLLEGGADVNSGDPSPLLLATGNNNMKTAKLLLDAGANPNYKDFRSPLYEAALNNENIEMVKLLIEAGANPNMYYAEGSIISQCCSRGQFRRDGNKPIQLGEKRFQIVKHLLDSGASPNGKSPHTEWPPCPLFMPIALGDLRTVELLISYGAKLTGNAVLSAVNQAAYLGDFETIEYLLEQGFKPNPPKVNKKRHVAPLNYAIYAGHLELVKLLIKSKANINYTPTDKSDYVIPKEYLVFHPVACAVVSKQMEILIFLLENGSDPNGLPEEHFSYANPIFHTFHHSFSSSECVEYIDVLLDYGADLNIKHEGKAPIRWAELNEKDDVIDYLRSRGAT